MEKRSQCHHFRRPLKRLYNKFFQKTSPCKPARGGPHRRELKPVRARRRPRARGGPHRRELKPVRARRRPRARGGPHRRELKPVRARRRPRARGGPTIYERDVGLVERSYIVGPPLAGGLPGARTALS